MPNRLSNSAVNRFQDCPESYRLHYQEGLRSMYQSAALLHGTAIDTVITAMLKDRDANVDPIKIYNHVSKYQIINGVETYLPTFTNIVYSNSDFDFDLLIEEDYKSIVDTFKLTTTQDVSIKDFIKSEIDKVYAEKDYMGFKGLPEERKAFLNYCNYLSLYRKGLLMIDAVQKQIFPKITKVLGVQEFVKLENDASDSVIGYADLVCNWEGIKEPIVFDFKTSSRNYEEDSVLTSPQLTLYVHALSDKFENTRKAGFIVLNKNIRKNKTKVCSKCDFDGTGTRFKSCPNELEGKRCDGPWIEKMKPSVYIQVLIDDIPEQTEKIVLDNYDFINQSIKHNVFSRNFSSCIKYNGQVKCAFFDKCYKGSDEGLIKIQEKK